MSDFSISNVALATANPPVAQKANLEAAGGSGDRIEKAAPLVNRTQRNGSADLQKIRPKRQESPKSTSGNGGGDPFSAEGLAGTLARVSETLEQLLPEARPNTRLRINVDADTGRFIYQSIDTESGEVVAQFPPEQLLELLKAQSEILGVFLDGEV